MAKHALTIWFETEAENDREELNALGARLFHAALPGREIEYDVDEVRDPAYHYCEWCWGDRPRFDSTEAYRDHLREAHPDEAW